MLQYDLVVIGGGPAGLAAAIEAARNGVKKVVVIERERELGGILQQCIHSGFGLHIFQEELTGPEYAARFIAQLQEMGIEYKLNTMVVDILPDKSLHVVNSEDGFLVIQAKAVILAMGCRERTREAIAIPGKRPAGIFTAGTAQRYINIEGYMVGKKVVIAGSGDIGLIMARRLTLEEAEVLAVVEIMPFPGGLNRNIVQCLDDFHIPLLLQHTVTEILGKERIEGVVVARVDEHRKPIPGTEKTYTCDTLLLSVGLIPENELSCKAGIVLDKVTKGPVVNEARETSVSGIFACGNAVHVHDLVDFVTRESRLAGKSAARYLQGELECGPNMIKTRPGPGVQYIVPQMIRRENSEENLELFLRVDNIYHDASLVVKADGELLQSFKRKYLAPGNMEQLVLDAAVLRHKPPSVLTVELELEEGMTQ